MKKRAENSLLSTYNRDIFTGCSIDQFLLMVVPFFFISIRVLNSEDELAVYLVTAI